MTELSSINWGKYCLNYRMQQDLTEEKSEMSSGTFTFPRTRWNLPLTITQLLLG